MQRRPLPRRRVGACLHDAPSTGGGGLSGPARLVGRRVLGLAIVGGVRQPGTERPEVVLSRHRFVLLGGRRPAADAGWLPLVPARLPLVPARRRATRSWPLAFALQALAACPARRPAPTTHRRIGRPRSAPRAGSRSGRRRPGDPPSARARPNRCSRGPARTRSRCRTRPRRPRRSHRARAPSGPSSGLGLGSGSGCRAAGLFGSAGLRRPASRLGLRRGGARRDPHRGRGHLHALRWHRVAASSGVSSRGFVGRRHAVLGGRHIGLEPRDTIFGRLGHAPSDSPARRANA